MIFSNQRSVADIQAKAKAALIEIDVAGVLEVCASLDPDRHWRAVPMIGYTAWVRVNSFQSAMLIGVTRHVFEIGTVIRDEDAFLACMNEHDGLTASGTTAKRKAASVPFVVGDRIQQLGKGHCAFAKVGGVINGRIVSIMDQSGALHPPDVYTAKKLPWKRVKNRDEGFDLLWNTIDVVSNAYWPLLRKLTLAQISVAGFALNDAGQRMVMAKGLIKTEDGSPTHKTEREKRISEKEELPEWLK